MKFTGNTRLIQPLLCCALFTLIWASALLPLYGQTSGNGLVLNERSEISDSMNNRDDNSTGKTGSSVDNETEEPELENIRPVSTRGKSLATALVLDVVLPGGGHFYRGDYYSGTAFLLLKAAGAWSIYFYYRDWEYRASLYHAAVKADAKDPYHDLYFIDEEGNYKSVLDYRHDYDRAAQMITFAVIANIAVYTASLITNYFLMRKERERSIPSFEVYTFSRGPGMSAPCIAVSCVIRI